MIERDLLELIGADLGLMYLQRFGSTVTPDLIEAAIKNNATPNVITGIPAPAPGSAPTPNLLLYSFISKRRACCV